MSTATEPARTHAPPRAVVRRFGLWHRLTHAVLALAVFGLVFTGMPLRYSAAFWASPLMQLWGGPRMAGVFHRAFAIMFFGSAAMHVGALVVLAIRGRLRPVFGPDSIVPGVEDVRHVPQYIRYLRGRGPMPVFGRFTYWEKFDYLAEIWGLLVIGLSGLVMWFPEEAARYVPGWVVNAALIFHSYEALLAMAFLFAIHFFNTHLRPEVFPVDPVIFTGTIPLEEVRERYPGWYGRLTGGGTRPVVTEGPGEDRRTGAAVVSAVFLTLGLVMLVLVMWAAIAEVVALLVDALT